MNSPDSRAYTVDAGTPDCVRFGYAPRLSSSPATLRNERREQSRLSDEIKLKRERILWIQIVPAG